MSPLKPGWYSDPHGSKMLRWWDGSEWTGQLHEPVSAVEPQAEPNPAPPQAPTAPSAPKYGYFPKAADPPSAQTTPAAASTDTSDDALSSEPSPETSNTESTSKVGVTSAHIGTPTPDPGPHSASSENPLQRYWRALREHVWLRWVSGVAAFILFVAIVGSGSSENSATGSAGADAGSGGGIVAVSIKSPADNSSTKSKTTSIAGTATEGSEVEIAGGETVKVGPAGNWSSQVSLDAGENVIEVQASKPGMTSSGEAVTVVRQATAAEKRELAAERRADRKKKAAAKRRKAAQVRAKRARAKQSFMNSAASIPYKKLNKNADKYAGKKVTYRGQIFQIQETGDIGGFMLLAVTDEGYGFWDDNVWVNFDHSISAGEEDVITIYGTVVGSTDYETQIGGSTYVPEIDARYIVTK